MTDTLYRHVKDDIVKSKPLKIRHYPDPKIFYIKNLDMVSEI